MCCTRVYITYQPWPYMYMYMYILHYVQKRNVHVSRVAVHHTPHKHSAWKTGGKNWSSTCNLPDWYSTIPCMVLVCNHVSNRTYSHLSTLIHSGPWNFKMRAKFTDRLHQTKWWTWTTLCINSPDTLSSKTYTYQQQTEEGRWNLCNERARVCICMFMSMCFSTRKCNSLDW